MHVKSQQVFRDEASNIQDGAQAAEKSIIYKKQIDHRQDKSV